MAGRFDCGCRYQLGIIGYGSNYEKEIAAARKSSNFPRDSTLTPLFQKTAEERVEQWQGKAWKKVCIVYKYQSKSFYIYVYES